MSFSVDTLQRLVIAFMHPMEHCSTSQIRETTERALAFQKVPDLLKLQMFNEHCEMYNINYEKFAKFVNSFKH